VRLWSTTAGRLALTFGGLMLVFGSAAFLSMRGLDEVHDLLHAVKKHEGAVRASLELASAVRDQYAHQAHTIILGNTTHLGFYGEAHARVRERLQEVRRHADGPEAAEWTTAIEQASDELDAIFRERIVPAVLAEDAQTIHREHARAQALVSLIQARVDDLTAHAEASITDFEQHAGLVQHQTVRGSLVAFAVATLLAAVLGVYIARSVARPVARLEAGAARVAAGDLDSRIEVEGADELARLAASFNRMTAALKDNQGRLIESEKLAGIGRLAAGVAHEINNPLGVILGYVRILQRDAGGKVAEDLSIVADETRRCQQIVDGLLDLSRPARAQDERVVLGQLCREVVDRLRDTEIVKCEQVTIEGDAVVAGSAQKLRQVVTNLIQNALDAAGTQGHVAVAIRSDAVGSARLAVADDGPGISEKDAQRLFEPFFTTKPKGTGLGLAVARAIARAHGGDIAVEAVSPHGASFVLTLPADRGVSA